MARSETVVVGQEERVMEPLPLDIKARAHQGKGTPEGTALILETTQAAAAAVRERLGSQSHQLQLTQMVGQD
jgi:hypothetical protein